MGSTVPERRAKLADMDRLELRSESESETGAFAALLGRVVRGGDVVLLEGTLGAGKTAFVRGVARGLGLHEDEPVTSPSFAVVQEYETRPRLVHADLYRLGSSDELLQLGLVDSLDDSSVGFVEWGNSHQSALDRVDLLIEIAGSGDDPRRLVASARSPRGLAMLDAWSELATA